MNIYSKKEQELLNINKKFKKTAFGHKAFIHSIVPAIAMIISIVVMIIVGIGIENEEISLMLEVLSFGILILSFALSGVTQLLYGMLLRDFAKSEKNEK